MNYKATYGGVSIYGTIISFYNLLFAGGSGTVTVTGVVWVVLPCAIDASHGGLARQHLNLSMPMDVHCAGVLHCIHLPFMLWARAFAC